nr:Chain B, Hepatocyte growth factor-regulated tyrosine kinase substrate [Homo sapiens]
PTPSAPVPL